MRKGKQKLRTLTLTDATSTLEENSNILIKVNGLHSKNSPKISIDRNLSFGKEGHNKQLENSKTNNGLMSVT